MSVVVQIAFGPISSISGKLDIARHVNYKMAGDELGQAANSDA